MIEKATQVRPETDEFPEAIGRIDRAFVGAKIFDGDQLLNEHALLESAGIVRDIIPNKLVPDSITTVELSGGVLAPGFVDLQVNGGGGVLFNDEISLASLETMARAHAITGATSILPTLITDTPVNVELAIRAVADAVRSKLPGILGLHLEGPHLSPDRCGAHDPSLIRAMSQTDLKQLCEAAQHLPVLKVTLSPENVTSEQIAALHKAGVLVSLGHSNCTFDEAIAATDAGARCVTHLFNAMSQIQARTPGLVGAAISDSRLSAGLIADNIHVHQASMTSALRAKNGPGKIFLVSDAMATIGSPIKSFNLNGRTVSRKGSQLTLPDGTLAGAHLELIDAVKNVVALGFDLDKVLAMVTSIPADIAGLPVGRLRSGQSATMVHFSESFELLSVWRDGIAVDQS